jgi:hypothetical protein
MATRPPRFASGRLTKTGTLVPTAAGGYSCDRSEPPPDAVVGSLLSAQLDALQQPIMDANLPGNLDGLLAHHLLGGRQLRCGWNLDR